MKKIALLLSLAGFAAFTLGAQVVQLDLGLDQTRYSVGGHPKAYLKIGLKGVDLVSSQRPALNLALVLDRSGSMEGEKLAKAKDAARVAVSLLKPSDIISLIIFDDNVDVLLPATRVSDSARIERAINSIEAGGSTALFAGVAKGAAEIRHYLDRNRVNRVILLSDGQANVGPDSPEALGELGADLGREGISVSTLGLGNGYNEDLMSRLAASSDGNHAFIENPRDLARVFQAEFRDAMSIVAMDVEIVITCRPGVRPLRIMNRDGDIRGGQIRIKLNQVLAAQEKYILVELELPIGSNSQTVQIADCQVNYQNQSKKAPETRSASVSASYSNDLAAIKSSVRKDVREQVVLQLATEANEAAVKLRDQGETEKAKQALKENSDRLKGAAIELDSPELKAYGEQNAQAADDLDKKDWSSQRKALKEEQYQNKTQQSY